MTSLAAALAARTLLRRDILEEADTAEGITAAWRANLVPTPPSIIAIAGFFPCGDRLGAHRRCWLRNVSSRRDDGSHASAQGIMMPASRGGGVTRPASNNEAICFDRPPLCRADGRRNHRAIARPSLRWAALRYYR